MALTWCHGRDLRPHERVNTCAGLFEQALCTAMRRCGSTTSQTAAPSQCRGTSPRHTQGSSLKSRWCGGEGKLPERQRVALFLHSPHRPICTSYSGHFIYSPSMSACRSSHPRSAFDDSLATTRPEQAGTPRNNETTESPWRSCLCDFGK